jgi:ribosomal protein S18 acetylase RimI-like enzyme
LCVALKPIDDGIAEMKRLYVKPSSRNKGISRSLVKNLIDFALEQNYHTIKLDTLNTMTAAMTLYESFGFVETAQYVHNPFETALFFELNLNYYKK